MPYTLYFRMLALIFHAPSPLLYLLDVPLESVELNDESFPKGAPEVYVTAPDIWCVNYQQISRTADDDSRQDLTTKASTSGAYL